ATNNKVLSILQASFPEGAYRFAVASAEFGSPVEVDLSPPDSQPLAPEFVDFDAAQAIDPSRPFVLTWQPVPGASTTDFLQVAVGNVFTTPSLLDPRALNGTASSVTVPAGILPPGFPSEAVVAIYRYQLTTNGTVIIFGYRATATKMHIKIL